MKEPEGRGNQGQCLEDAPHHHGSWLAIAFAAEEAAELATQRSASPRLGGVSGGVVGPRHGRHASPTKGALPSHMRLRLGKRHILA